MHQKSFGSGLIDSNEVHRRISKIPNDVSVLLYLKVLQYTMFYVEIPYYSLFLYHGLFTYPGFQQYFILALMLVITYHCLFPYCGCFCIFIFLCHDLFTFSVV